MCDISSVRENKKIKKKIEKKNNFFQYVSQFEPTI